MSTAAAGVGNVCGFGGATIDRRRVLQLDQAFHRAGGALHFAPHLAERRGGDRDVDRVDQELAQLAAGHFVAEHAMRALPQHERDRAEDHHRADGRQRRAHARAAHRDLERILDRLAVALAVQRLERERLHGLDRVQRFAGEAAGVGDRDPAIAATACAACARR